MSRIKRDTAAFLLFVCVASVAAHLAFSWMGFNPTDDGFILAGSRRITEGQVPHRDFIAIRPALSYFLHAPLVLLGGEYTFWISRYLVWLQFACVSWAWTAVISRMFEEKPGLALRVGCAAVAMAFCSHNFPIMAWHSIDALFLASVGLWLAMKGDRGKMAGYALIGASALCRQNFALVPPAVLVITGDWRRVRFWLSGAAPGAAMALYLAAVGALGEAVGQMSSQTGIVQVGLSRYFYHWYLPVGAVAGFAAARLACPRGEENARFGLGRIIGTALLLAAPLYLALKIRHSLKSPYFILFWIAAGAVAWLVVKEKRALKRGRAGILALLFAWCVSISIGYNTPALASGALVLFLMALARPAPALEGERRWPGGVPGLLTAAVVVVVLFCFVRARMLHVYLDRPAGELVWPVGEVLRGARLVKTNGNTYAFLEDLGRAIDKTRGKRFAIIPDLSCYWVRSPRTNPLPVDWAQGVELNNNRLMRRVSGEIDRRRGEIVIIVQKVSAFFLRDGFVPLPEGGRYGIVEHVRSRFDKVDQTRFFELYE